MEAIDRFFSHTVTWNNGCWWWFGSNMGKKKYGVFWFEGRKVVAHRWIYERYFGPIPSGLESHHTCETPWCVNPYHLEMISRTEHSATKNYKNPTHCKRGHLLSGDNMRIRERMFPSGLKYHRVCKQCKREWDYELRAKKHDNRNTASLD